MLASLGVWAKAMRMLQLVQKLIQQAGADVNARDPKSGNSALECAVEAGHEEVALSLVDLGATVDGATAADGKSRADRLLKRATPKVRSRLAYAISTQGERSAESGAAAAAAKPAGVLDFRPKLVDEVRGYIQRGDSFGAFAALDAGEEALREMPAKRDAEERARLALGLAELQLLLEESVRHRCSETLVSKLAADMESLGARLDWPALPLGTPRKAATVAGRLPLDGALEAAVGETHDEDMALLLLQLGRKSGKGSLQRLNTAPLLRSAAAYGMTMVIEELLTQCGADVNALDPRFGSSALDRAVEVGRQDAALLLLELGADPNCGRGLSALLERAKSAKLRSELRDAAIMNARKS
eukprot:TRINITY_DN33892_c0_g1_i3.p1 TRINITY_DN33892_c0_g1~~TRINITY_DN33892_c0_g1_i3.p1  ORF type:complete len:357 (-),score=102.56 TRINITY_DN33892_c0_g1_i3:204-1274(-)